jgi:hypothetical protein
MGWPHVPEFGVWRLSVLRIGTMTRHTVKLMLSKRCLDKSRTCFGVKFQCAEGQRPAQKESIDPR